MAQLVPVDGDPFATAPAAAAQPRLVPVDNDPFSQPAVTASARSSAARRGVDTSTPTTASPDQWSDTGSAWDDVGKAARQGAAGVNEGVSTHILRPLDTAASGVNSAIDKVTGETTPSTHLLEGAFNKYFVDPNGPPQTNAQRVVREGGNLVGANVPSLAIGAGVANAGIRSGVTLAEQAAPGISNKIRGAADAVLNWMAENPVKAAATDTTGAFQAGAGGETGRGMAEEAGYGPQGQAVAQTIGQLGVPAGIAGYERIAPSLIAARLVAAAAKKGVQMVPESVIPESMRPASGTAADRQAENLAYANREGKYANPAEPAPPEPGWLTRQQDVGAQQRTENAGKTVQDEMGQITSRPEAAANMSIAERLKQNIPGFQPGIAKETRDPALLNLQARLESNATGSDLRTAQERYDASAQALRDKATSLAPGNGTEMPQDTVQRAAQARVQNLDNAIEQQKQNVQSKIDQRQQSSTSALADQQTAAQGKIKELSDSLPESDPSAVGKYLRDTRSSLKQEADDKVTALRNAIDPEGTSQVEIGKDEKGEPIYAKVGQVLDARTRILQQRRLIQSASAKSPDDMARLDQLDRQLTTLNNFVDKLRLPDSGMQERFDAFRNYYKNDYVPRFSEGAGRDIGRYDQFGYDKNRVAAEDVPGAFFKPNNISEARQFNKLYGEDPQARQQMTDYALDDLRRSAVDPNTGLIREGTVNKWLAKNERVLNEMPWVRDAVTGKNPDAQYAQARYLAQKQKLATNPKTLAQVEPDVGALQQRFGDLEQRQRTVADANLTKTLGGTPEKTLDVALNDWQVMRSLKRATGDDQQAEAALTRAVMNRAPDVMDAAKFGKWLDGHDRVLRQVLTPQHLQALQDIRKAAEIQTQLPRPAGTAERPKSTLAKAGATIGTPIKSLLQRFLAVAQGRVGKPYTAFDIGTRMIDSFTERETDAVWKEALFNPKVAETLANVVKSKGATGLQLGRLRNYMLTMGAIDATDQNQPQQ